MIVSPTQILFSALFPRLRCWLSWAFLGFHWFFCMARAQESFPNGPTPTIEQKMSVSTSQRPLSSMVLAGLCWSNNCFAELHIEILNSPSWFAVLKHRTPQLLSFSNSDIGVSPTQILELGLFPRLRYWSCACFPDSDLGFGLVSPTQVLVFCCFPDSRRVQGLSPPTQHVFGDCFPDSDPVFGSVSPTQILAFLGIPSLSLVLLHG
jgi:hypothetical protein